MENLINESIQMLNDVIKRVDTLNKRLIIAIVVAIISYNAALTIILGFYFLGQGYPDSSQLIQNESVKIEQKIQKQEEPK